MHDGDMRRHTIYICCTWTTDITHERNFSYIGQSSFRHSYCGPSYNDRCGASSKRQKREMGAGPLACFILVVDSRLLFFDWEQTAKTRSARPWRHGTERCRHARAWSCGPLATAPVSVFSFPPSGSVKRSSRTSQSKHRDMAAEVDQTSKSGCHYVKNDFFSNGSNFFL